jgi:predicted TIM-barrel fold metal-dependent hydrolase
VTIPYPIIDVHAHVIPRVSGRNRLGSLRPDRFGCVLRGGKRVPLLPPYFLDTTFPVEALLELMDREGVAKAVLVQNPTLGSCNEYIGQCLQRYPARFAGTIQIDPRSENAADELARLASPTQNILKLELSFDWGWTGLYPDFRIDEPAAADLWEVVADAGLTVIMDFGPPGNPGYQVDAFDAITSRFPQTHFLVEHLGYLTAVGAEDAAARAQRHQLLELAQKPNVWFGLSAVPVLLAEPYPCPRANTLLREAVELLGADKLLWGSDLPVTLGLHTYRQLVDTVRCEASFLSEVDKEKILHHNALAVFSTLTDITTTGS